MTKPRNKSFTAKLYVYLVHAISTGTRPTINEIAYDLVTRSRGVAVGIRHLNNRAARLNIPPITSVIARERVEGESEFSAHDYMYELNQLRKLARLDGYKGHARLTVQDIGDVPTSKAADGRVAIAVGGPKFGDEIHLVKLPFGAKPDVEHVYEYYKGL